MSATSCGVREAMEPEPETAPARGGTGAILGVVVVFEGRQVGNTASATWLQRSMSRPRDGVEDGVTREEARRSQRREVEYEAAQAGRNVEILSARLKNTTVMAFSKPAPAGRRVVTRCPRPKGSRDGRPDAKLPGERARPPLPTPGEIDAIGVPPMHDVGGRGVVRGGTMAGGFLAGVACVIAAQALDPSQLSYRSLSVLTFTGHRSGPQVPKYLLKCRQHWTDQRSIVA
jgi:hypothetical protein